MKIISRTLSLLPVALLFGFGVSIFYLAAIMFYVTGRLPDVSAALDSLAGFEWIVEALGG